MRWLTLSLLALAACTGAVPAAPDRVGPGYTTGGGEWNTGGGITAVVRVFERDGATTVCVAWATDRQSALTIHLNEDVMAAASVFAGGTRLVHGLGFMTRVAYAPDITGAGAACVTSAVPWSPAFAEARPRLRFPPMVFVDDLEGGMMGIRGAVFRERPRPDILG